MNKTNIPFADLKKKTPSITIMGKPITKLPEDLYIPPEALQIFLETFEGPMDLLLYLIKRNDMDVINIKVAKITKQYMQYVELMKAYQFDLAAEYLVMAATLAEIKSRMLLPKTYTNEEEIDPRAELIRRLQEYERFKEVAIKIDNLPRIRRDIHVANTQLTKKTIEKKHPNIQINDIIQALIQVIRQTQMYVNHQIQNEKISTREKMSHILSQLSNQKFTPFVSLFILEEGKLGVVVTFMAILELIKESLIEIIQSAYNSSIFIKAKNNDSTR